MARRHSYPIFKIAATLFGAAFGGVECWLNADTVAHLDGWLSPSVAIVIMASVGALAALPLAERASKARQYVKACGLIVLFGLMAAYSLTASLDRVAGWKDGAVAAAQGGNTRVTLAQEGYRTAQKAVETECATGRGRRCREAEAALAEARKAYSAAPATRVEDSGTARIVAVLPFLSAGSVRLYQPLILPVAFQLGAFTMLALGLSPRAKETPVPAASAAKPKKARKPRKRKLTAVSVAENIIPLRARAR